MLSLTPVSLSEANAFVARYHRHHKPVVGHKFSIGCMADGRLVGVAIVGRPVSRYLDNGLTLEVNRLCTDGTKNACSFLYAAAWRAARAMGYRKIITYILDTESGAARRPCVFCRHLRHPRRFPRRHLCGQFRDVALWRPYFLHQPQFELLAAAFLLLRASALTPERSFDYGKQT